MRRFTGFFIAFLLLIPGISPATPQKITSVAGQTLTLAEGQQLWLLGLWGPQPGTDTSPGEPGAAEAEAALAADAVGRMASTSSLMGPDRSGRFGAIVTLEGDLASLNERLVRGGWARAYLVPGLPK
ncbi:hypothetical protein VZ95_15165, partial [Elstera litoralis]